ncbi:cysteine desulfurase family protein [Curtanaerobium respiraculi]|uniref:cysteine desulfurase family protein n=1 Tax=Curtanaerobium respiraculi TaxID=2949669 RepID=UPI0024B344A0|nr:cysteine desulfurase family protein [Curtanaerobium respiraculi]
MDFIYLDHAAATPLDARVRKAMEPYGSDLFFNPSSPYAPAVRVRQAYEQARADLAHAIGGKPAEVIITAGATESINLAFGSIEGHAVIPVIEHASVRESAAKHPCTLVGVDARGRVNPDDIAKAIRPDTRLVSVGVANNEIGTVQPVRAIAAVVRAERLRRLQSGNTAPLFLHCDASQGAGQIDINTSSLGVDMLTCNAGKIYGPKQMGLLWAAPDVPLRPTVVGGGQERGLRSGTENVAGAVGFARALSLAVEGRKEEAIRLANLRDGLQNTLLRAFPDAVVSGHKKHRLPGHLHISFPHIDAERIVFKLEDVGVLVGTGAACAANKSARSHVLEAIGMPPELADGSLRLTLGRLSTEENTARAAELIIAAIRSEYDRIGMTRSSSDAGGGAR